MPARDASNFRPSSTALESFTVTIAGTSVGRNRLAGADWLIVKDNVAVPVPDEFVALNPTLNVPAAVGVPEITPVDVATESPAGSPVALKLVGLLLAVIV